MSNKEIGTIPAGYTRVYPVYTWHAEELMKASRWIAGLMKLKSQKADAAEDEDYYFLRDLYKRLCDLMQVLRDETGGIVYLDKEDLELVKQTAEWVN